MNEILKLENLQKSFGTLRVLTDINLTVHQGEVVTVIGASGSGKSITLKCIAGVETADRGRIVLDGKILYDSEKKIDLPPQKRKIGYLFQGYALFPNMTIEENIKTGLKAKRFPKDEIQHSNIKEYETDKKM